MIRSHAKPGSPITRGWWWIFTDDREWCILIFVWGMTVVDLQGVVGCVCGA